MKANIDATFSYLSSLGINVDTHTCVFTDGAISVRLLDTVDSASAKLTARFGAYTESENTRMWREWQVTATRKVKITYVPGVYRYIHLEDTVAKVAK